MSKRDFLLEVGLEEIPARFVTDAMNQLAENVEKWLQENRLEYGEVVKYSTPRRLAVYIKDLAEKQLDTEEEAKGPSKKIAVDVEGNWTKAALGFARGQGVSVDELIFKEVKGESYVFAKKYIKGKETVELLQGLKDVVTQLHFPVNMKWADYDLRYVRPIKWLVAMFGNEVIPFSITDIDTANFTMGHRFLGEKTFLQSADEYTSSLRKQYVIVDPLERKKMIIEQIEQIGNKNNWEIPIDESLLEEVTNLVEYPTVFFGQFDEKFLHIPEDVLITSMREHQRYFPVKSKEGNLLQFFIGVRNGDEHHLENVKKGNEKVLRARLQDAEFFYQEDLKTPLEQYVDKLESIVYHDELGSMGDKVRRIKDIADRICDLLNVDEKTKEKVERTVTLCKADLVTLMVDEFPELEGKMGEEYALKSGEDKEVAQGIYEHYLPKQSGDVLPETNVGSIVSVADKVDTLVANFGIGLIPTGSQDPHGLRRQTAGFIQIWLANNWTFHFTQFLDGVIHLTEKRGILKRERAVVLEDVIHFVKLRLKNLLQEEGIRYDVIDAVLNGEISNVPVIFEKARFLNKQLDNEEFKHVVEAFSRVTNIAKNVSSGGEVKEELLIEDEEVRLYRKKEEVEQVVSQHLQQGNIAEAFSELAELKDEINDYFDHVMVMVDDKQLKQNRLNQMKDCAGLIHSFADFSNIVFHS